MPTHPQSLPERPSLRHLKLQAKDLLKAGGAKSVAESLFQVARSYGFSSWPKLKAHVESLEQASELKHAIDTNDLDRVKNLMMSNPKLHRAPLGYGKDGPLTWVAECRIPWEPPGPTRLAMAKWMIENGSDVHQGGDGPLMRAALVGHRIPMMELLVSYGADVNASWHGHFPIVFAPCETIDPDALQWLLYHGAHPNLSPASALDYVIGTYSRAPERLSACIDILINAGVKTRYEGSPVLELLRGRFEPNAALLDERFSELDFGGTGYRRMTLKGATLLHVAAEYGFMDAVRLLLDRGADVNARATVDAIGVGGQTPIFHAATQFYDEGLPIVQLLIERGADLNIRVKLPGHYERPGEIVECTPLEYAQLFPGTSNKTVELLHSYRSA